MSLFLAAALLLSSLSSSDGCSLGPDGQPMQGLESLLSAQEYQKYQAKPRYKERIAEFRKALERYSDQVERQVRSRQREALQSTLHSISCLALHILNEPTRESFPKDWRSKNVKKLEIRLRKLVDLLRQAKYSFSLEVQASFDQSAQHLDKLRDQMLEGLFGQPLERQGRPPKPAAEPGFSSSHSFLPSAGALQTRHRTSHQEFTEAELMELRNYQDLKKRVDVFLEIAESRLDEIHLRMTGQPYQPVASAGEDDKGKKKKKKKKKKGAEPPAEQPNPLEFFTYADLVYGYERAIEGITVNVDDKYKRTPDKELRKSLETLNGKIQEFIPRLAPVMELAIEKKDEDLYRQVQRAQQTSEIALKGSQMFLGAPEK